MKPIDKAIFWMVSESSGRNESERIGGLETRKLQGPSLTHRNPASASDYFALRFEAVMLIQS
jgi:hypothetical protein